MDVKYVECKRKDFIGTKQFILDLQAAIDDGYRFSKSEKMSEISKILPFPRFRLEKEGVATDEVVVTVAGTQVTPVEDSFEEVVADTPDIKEEAPKGEAKPAKSTKAKGKAKKSK